MQLKYPRSINAVFQHLASHDQFWLEAYVRQGSGLIERSIAPQVIAQKREAARKGTRARKGRVIREARITKSHRP